jgi:hypothetical protein
MKNVYISNNSWMWASIGDSICDSAGRVVLAFAEPTEYSTMGIVETRAIVRGLRPTLELNLQRLMIDGDDFLLVQQLHGEHRNSWDLYTNLIRKR